MHRNSRWAWVRTADHPLVMALGDGAGRLSEYVRFSRYMRTKSVADAAAPVVLARFDDDERTPALVEHQVGRGRVLLFTSSIDLAWNNWAAAVDGSYVITLLELVQHLARSEMHPSAFVSGVPLTVPIALSDYEPQVVFRSPRYPETPATSGTPDAPSANDGELAVLRGPVADELGTYTVELTPRSGPLETRPLCVNPDPRESNLRRATRAELGAALGDIPHTFATLNSPAGDTGVGLAPRTVAAAAELAGRGADE